jgi:ubiquinone/menaquinone biosynthesis C-methylase UbiE
MSGSEKTGGPMSEAAFEEMSAKFEAGRYQRKPLGEILLEAGVAPGMTVLDFGCGPGGYSIPAAQIVGPAGRVHALDRVPLAAKKVTAKAAAKGLDNLRTITSTGPTGLDDDSVDVVLLFDVLHNLAEPEPIMLELRRVLKSSGTLAVEDHHLADAELVEKTTTGGLFTLRGKGRWSHLFDPRP